MAISGAIRAGKAFIEMGVETNALYRGLGEIKKKLEAFTSVGIKLAAVGGSITGPLGKLFSDAAQRSNSIAGLSAQFGLTTDAMSGLASGFETAGVSFEGFQSILDSLGGKLTNADGLFNELYLTSQALAKMPIDKSMEKIFEQISKIPNPMKRAEIAFEMFGESARNLMPFINDGAEGFRRLQAAGDGLKMDPASVERGKAAWQSFNVIMASVKTALLDIGSALMPTVEEIKEMVSWVQTVTANIREWIVANKQTIQIAFEVGAALVIVGTGLIAIGSAASIAGFAVAGFVTLASAGFTVIAVAVKLVVAAVGLLLSPIGLIGLAIGGIVAAFLTWTETGRSVADSIGGYFTGMWSKLKAGVMDVVKVFTDTFGGIVAALKKGDLALAGEIAMAGLQVVWAKASLGMTQVWVAFKETIVDVFRDAVAGIKIMLTYIAEFAALAVIEPLQKILNLAARAADAVDATETAERIRGALGDANPENLRRGGEAMRKEIVDEREKKRAEDEEFRAASIAKGREDVTSASSRLAELIAKAKEEGTPPASVGSVSDAQKKELMNTGPLLAAKVKGTFSTSASAQQLGVGDTVAKRNLELNQKIAQNSDSLPEIKRGITELGTALRVK